MSEMPAEVPPRRSTGGGIKGTFTNRIGPLPMWVWLVIVAGILVAWRLYASRKANAQQAATSAADTSTAASDVPQFVNQTFVSASPPTAGPPGPAGPAGPAGPPGQVKTPAPRPAPVSRTATPGMPTGIRATKVTGNSIAAAWQKVAGATSYIVRVTYQGKLVKQMTTHSPNATITGLGPDHTYTVHVAAVGPGGQSSETNGPAVKTTR